MRLFQVILRTNRGINELSDRIDIAVIGAGVVGLAIAARLAQLGREVVVLEAENAIGTATSSRNSEVIHAGLYYPEGSLKAELCVRGRDMLYAYGQSHAIPTKRIGKLIVAADDTQLAGLEKLYQQGLKNGVTDLEMITGAQAASMEPNLTTVAAALYSPSTGLVDSHAFMLALQGDLENAGGVVALKSPVTGAQIISDDEIELSIGGETPSTLICNLLINAGGHGAWEAAKAVRGLDPARIPPHHLSKGCYFMLSGKAPFSRLIYPLPTSTSLGLHYTLDLGGQGRFGPDAQWVEDMDYEVDPARAESFYAAIRRYWPQLPDGALSPAYSGIRPKIQAPGEPAHDFVIMGPGANGTGHSGVIELYGIESPGLTAALAIAERVAAMAGISA